MIILKATNETLRLITSSSSAIDVHVSYMGLASLEATAISSQETAITTATTTTILDAPGVSAQKQVKLITINNIGTSTNIIKIIKSIGGTEYRIKIATLDPGESLSYNDGVGFEKVGISGDSNMRQVNNGSDVFSSKSINYLKIASAEAAGQIQFLGMSAGLPGAWAPGTPGLSGRICLSNESGAINLPTPTIGKNYLTSWSCVSTVASFPFIMDILWVNSGINVTSTASQTINSIELPPRDLNGSINGENVLFGLLCVSPTTNASGVSVLASYTNSNGVSGKTANLTWPVTAVFGCLVPFFCAAGDSGIKSIENITLGASLGGGSVSLVAYRIISGMPCLLANVGNVLKNEALNIEIPPNACLSVAFMATATTPNTITGSLVIEEK